MEPARRAPLTVPRALVSALLCAALMAATAWSVLGAGWADNAGGAAVVAVVATIEAALLARAQVPRGVVLVLVPVLALAAIVPTTLGAMPFDGNGTLSHVIGRYTSALTSGLAASTDWPFTVGLCAVLWLCGFWVGWLAMRERRGVLAVLPVFAVLATNVVNTHEINSIGLPVGLAVCLSLLVVADAHFDGLQDRWNHWGVAALPGTRRRFAVTVAVASALLTLVALLLPPVSSADISGRFFRGGGPGSGPGGSGSQVQGAVPIKFNGATEPGGPLVSEPQPVLTYSVDTIAPVYLRVVTDTQFISGNWYPDHSGGTDWGGVQFQGGSLPRDRNPADGGTARSVSVVHAQIVMQTDATGDSNLTPFIGEPDRIDQPAIAYGHEASAGLLTVDAVQLPNGVHSGTVVSTTGMVSTATAAQLRSAGTDYPAFVRLYTQLPNDYTNGVALVTLLAQEWTRGLSNPYDEAAAIEAKLRNSSDFKYTLDPPPSPPNEWPIVYFLTTSNRGYCQYFASAMGAMLRSLGIPTRLVNGFGPGTTQAQSGRQGTRQQVVSTSDAHTWVEAYFPGYGWVPFEPTPPSTDGNYVPFSRGAGAASPAPPSSAPAANTAPNVKPGNNDVANIGQPPPASVSHLPSALQVLSWIGLGVAGVVVLILLWLLLPRSPSATWRRLEALGAASGVRRRPSETYMEYVRRFGTASPRVRTALDEMAVLVGRVEFSHHDRDVAAARRTRAAWYSVLRSLPWLSLSLRRHAHAA